jgi:methionyl aminopeptidase
MGRKSGIPIKNQQDIEKMRLAGQLAAELLVMIEPKVVSGISTLEINDIIHEYTVARGALSAPLNYRGFPKSCCTSVNNVVCHGIPSAKEVLKGGDIINIDVTVKRDGYHGDTSKTFFVGEVDPKIISFVERVEEAMYLAIKCVRPNQYFSEIGNRIHRFLKPFNHGIVRALGGHGIGKSFHEDPFITHHKTNQRGEKMKAGMTFTVEPMVNLSANYDVFIDAKDKWTVFTKDSSLSAQFEHTVLVTETGVEILTDRTRIKI